MRMSLNFSTTKQTSMLPNRLMSIEMVKAIMKPSFKKLQTCPKGKKKSGTLPNIKKNQKTNTRHCQVLDNSKLLKFRAGNWKISRTRVE